MKTINLTIEEFELLRERLESDLPLSSISF